VRSSSQDTDILLAASININDMTTYEPFHIFFINFRPIPGQTVAISGSVSIVPSKKVILAIEQSFGDKLKCLN